MTARDFLGQELSVGDLVVYPVASGRSIQMSAGTILDLTVITPQEEKDYRIERRDWYHHARTVPNSRYGTWDDQQIEVAIGADVQRHKMQAGRLVKAKVQPMEVTSRWKQYHGDWNIFQRTGTKVVKPITLREGAANMVKITQ